MSTAVAAPAPSITIISPVKDFLFFFLSSTVVLLCWFASSVMHVPGYAILIAVAIASNGPHLVSTWTRVYFDSREWKSRKINTIVVPICICLAVFLANWKLDFGARLTNSAILYWATWHFVAQNWGILRIYQRKSGEALTSTAMQLEKPLLLLIVLFCLSHRLYTGPRVLFGIEVFYPPLPRALVLGLLAPIAVLVVTLLTIRIRERHVPHARASWLRLVFIACSFLGFFVPFQLITSDDTSAFAAAACWHGFQYLGMVHHYNRNVWKRGVDPNAKVISWVSQPGWQRGFLYWALLMALAGVVYVGAAIFSSLTSGAVEGVKMPWDPIITALPAWGFQSWAAIIWTGATLSHYWIDGVIWKLRKPELAQRVGIQLGESHVPNA